jgi:hypothetical protein
MTRRRRTADADPSFTFQYGNQFVLGDDGADIDTAPTCTVTVAHTNFGLYPIVCSGGTDTNYQFSYVDGTLKVEKRLATWTTNPASKTYGDSDPSPLTSGLGSNFVAGDGVTASYSRVAGENASPPTYHITATLSATGDLNNYIITNAGAEFTINKRLATWTTNTASKTYGDSDPAGLTTGSGNELCRHR